MVSSTIIEDITQEDGRRQIVEEHIDEIGRSHTVRYICPSGFDADAAIAARALKLDEKFVRDEVLLAVNRVIDGENPMEMSFDFCTANQAYRAMILYAMKDKLPQLLLTLKPLVEYLKANYNSSQIANALGITVTQLGRILDRYNAIIAVESFFTSDAALVEEIE